LRQNERIDKTKFYLTKTKTSLKTSQTTKIVPITIRLNITNKIIAVFFMF